MKPHILFFNILILLSACNGQTANENMEARHSNEQSIIGETVTELGDNIMVVYQDQDNNYWFGSWDSGVYKYDGTTLTHYTSKHGLANNRVDQIKEDGKGNMYFVGCHPISTVSKFDGSQFTTLRSEYSTDWTLNETDLWFKHAYRQEMVYRYDGDTLYELLLPQPPGLNNPFEIYSIYKDRKGNMWFGTNPVGVCRYDGENFDWITEEDVTEFRDEGANGVRSIAEDKNGDFWFNTENRYKVYDREESEDSGFYTRHSSIGGLDGEEDSHLDEYLSIVRDNDDNLWFVTYLDGVWKYDGSEITRYPVEESGKQISLFSIYKDNAGVLWLGTHENGVYRLEGEDFVKFRP